MVFQNLSKLLGQFSQLSTAHDDPNVANIDNTLRRLGNGSFKEIQAYEVAHAVTVLARMSTSGKELGVESVPDFLSAKEVFEQNRELCLSFLRRGCDGSDVEARSEYEARRVCLLELMPNYLGDEVVATCLKELKTINVRAVIPRDETASDCIGFKIWLDSKLTYASLLPASAGLPLVKTYSMGRQMSDFFSSVERSPYLMVALNSEGRGAPIDQFNPASEGPVGLVAVKAFSRSIDVMLAAMILEDLFFDFAQGAGFISQYPLDAFDTLKWQTLRSAKSAWDVCSSPLVSNMRLLSELAGTDLILPGTIERVMLSPKYLLDRHFNQIIEDMNQALAAKEVKRQSRSQISPILSSNVQSTSGTTEISPQTVSEKQKFFRALQGAAPTGTNLKEFAETHRDLYSAFKRGRASLTECLDLVRSGLTAFPSSPESDTWSESLTSPINESDGTQLVDIKDNDAIVLSETNVLDRETYEIVGYSSPWFQKWLASIPERERRLVEKRLTYAREGFLLDYTPWRSEPGLFEFRFHLGDGKRIFFSFSGDNKIVLRSAGSKKDQDSVAAAAIRNVGD